MAFLLHQVMKDLRLLPLLAGETVEQKVAAFRNYDDVVRHCLPDVLLATLSILYTQYKQIRYDLHPLYVCVHLHCRYETLLPSAVLSAPGPCRMEGWTQ